ncbi:MAG: 2-hydroxyacyl-CoA dehydratase [Bacilli bacterium]
MVKVSFPHIANYYIPVNILLSNILNCEIIVPPRITHKTIELGTKYSPDYICTPFKYTLGSFLEVEPDIALQLGGGCKYGYYFELQQEILKNQGYKTKIINLISKGKFDYKKIKNEYKNFDHKNIFKTFYYLFLSIQIMKKMDEIENKIRQNYTKELEKKYENYLNKIKDEKSIINFNIKTRKMKKEIKPQKKKIKIAIIGELYTLMEPYSNFNLEKLLLEKGVSITRNTNATYLLFKKKKRIKKMIKKSSYIDSMMGSDASDNICLTEKYCKEQYDAIIHIKSSFCTPEIAAMPIISKICKDFNIPLVMLSFDTNTSETGIITRIEALIDLIEMRKTNV